MDGSISMVLPCVSNDMNREMNMEMILMRIAAAA
jgi:hypothetical protein